MANDREILREIWEGKLPINFQVNGNEVDGLQKPSPFYLMIPRVSYLPLVTDKVNQYITKTKQTPRFQVIL
jgi:autophagy-related protein 5